MAEENKALASPSTIIVGGGKSNPWPWIIGGALGVGLLIGGGILLYKKIFGSEDISGDIELAVESLQETIAAGDEVAVNVSVTNIGEDTIEPRIRFDLKQGTGGTTTVNENPDGFISFSEIESGETVTKQMSMTVPADWTAGTVIYGRLVLSGHEGTVWTDQVARIPTAADLQIINVEAVNSMVATGDVAQVDLTVNNPNSTAITIGLALDLKKIASGSTWTPAPSESGDFTIVTFQPGQSTVRLDSYDIPADWGGVSVAARIMGRYLSGSIWTSKFYFWGDTSGSNAYRIFTITETEAQAYLYISSDLSEGLVAKCSPVGTPFEYEISYNNTGSQAIEADFVFGLRTQALIGTYVEKSTKKTIQPGSGSFIIKSITPGSSWDGNLLDVRILVRHGANIVVNSQGETDDTGGYPSDIIYEGDKVVYAGSSQIKAYSSESFIIRQVPADRLVTNGQSISFTLGVKHIGPAKVYKAGCYIKTEAPYWIAKAFTAPESIEWEDLEITVPGKFISNLSSGRVIDELMAFMEAEIVPSVPKVDSELLFANWDAALTVK